MLHTQARTHAQLIQALHTRIIPGPQTTRSVQVAGDLEPVLKLAGIDHACEVDARLGFL